MSVNVIVKFPGVDETIKIENVPYTTKISKLKKQICKITKFEGDLEKVKIIQLGRIIDLDSELGSLSLDDEQQIQIFVTGLRSRFQSKNAEIQQPKPHLNHEQQPQEQPNQRRPNDQPLPNIPPNNNFNNFNNNFNNFNNQPRNNNGYMFGRRINNNNNNFGRPRNSFFSIRTVLLFITFLAVFLIIYRSFVYAKVAPTERKQSITNVFRDPFRRARSFSYKSLLNLKTVAFILVLLLFIIPLTKIRWNRDMATTAFVFFFKSMLPSFSNAEIPAGQRRRI